MKMCSKCLEEKPASDFHKKSNAKDGLQTYCKMCNIARVKRWQGDNPEKYQQYVSERDAKEKETGYLRKKARMYNISEDELRSLLDKANGKCEICQQPPNKWLVVDHCHTKGNVRGILCERCNQALGLFRDDPQIMRSAIKYLNK